MVLNEEDDLRLLDDYFIVKNFLWIFPLKWPAIICLWMYTIFFGFFMKHTAYDLFEAGFDFTLVISYYRLIKWILSFFCCMACLASLKYQRAIRGGFGCIYFFTVLCIFRVLIQFSSIREPSIIYLYHIYVGAMYEFCKPIEDSSMKYFCYMVFTISVTLGVHISMVIFSYHRETWIPINPALEGNVADLHIESTTAVAPSGSQSASGGSKQKGKKGNKKRGRR